MRIDTEKALSVLDAIRAGIENENSAAEAWFEAAMERGRRMRAMNEDALNYSYALSKQLSTAYALATSYGDLALDEEMRIAVQVALTPILERRLAEAQERAK